jgi:hypothetical protein
MIDPITALATATSAFNLIKKGFEVGRDVESMGSDLGRWMGAMSDLKKADEYAKNHLYLKKYLTLVQSKKKPWPHSWRRRRQKICVMNSRN